MQTDLFSSSSSAFRRHQARRRHPALTPPSAGAAVATMPAPGTGGTSPDGEPVLIGGDGVPRPFSQALGFIGDGGGFEGARASSSRGYVWFPQMDSRKEINHTNRTEIDRKGRWAYANDGFVRRVVNGMARMIGYHMPQPRTPDREWNGIAKRAFMEIARSRFRFDRGGKFNFFSYQLNVNKLELKSGDSLTLPTIGAGNTTQFLCYESHQIGDGMMNHRREQGDRQRWFDGVLVDRHNRARKYRILDPDDPRRFRDVAAGSAFLFARYERPGQNRGMSALAHLVNDLLDVREISGDMGTAMKTRNLIGFYLAAKDPETPLPGAKGVQANLKRYLRENQDSDSDGARSGDGDDETIAYEEIFGGGNIYRAEGYEPKVLESAQPHENEMAFLDWKIRRMSLGMDIAPELLWDIGTLNGNTQRWLGEDAQEMLDCRRMETCVPFCQWVWFMVIGQLISSGQLPQPKIPKDQADHVGWWTVDWIPMRKKTIDRGREGRLRLEERRALLKNFDTLYSEEQKDWNEEIEQWLHEIDTIAAMMDRMSWPDDRKELVMANLLAPPPGTSVLDAIGGDAVEGDDGPTDQEIREAEEEDGAAT